MSQIFGINQNTATAVEQLNELFKSLGITVGSDGSISLPGVGEGETLDLESLPSLPAPAGPLSLDTLLSSIGDEVRRQTCRDGVASLELKGEQQAEINAKELEEIAKQLEKMKSKGIADAFLIGKAQVYFQCALATFSNRTPNILWVSLHLQMATVASIPFMLIPLTHSRQEPQLYRRHNRVRWFLPASPLSFVQLHQIRILESCRNIPDMYS